MKRPTAKPARSKSKSSTPQLEATEHKGDLLIRDLWHNGTDSVHDMRIMNTDDNSYLAKITEKCLQEAEQAKKKMYLEAYHQQRRHVLPFVAFVDELLSVEASANLKRIASRLTKKWRQPYYRKCRWVNIIIAITLVRATHQCIGGFQGADAQYQRPGPSVVRQLWDQPMHLSNMGN